MTALLLDQNLSPRLAQRLASIFPGSLHVSQVGLATALDRQVWEYARTNSLMLVSKDADFSELGLMRGFPPKVIWIRRGNCSTSDIEYLLRSNVDVIDEFAQDTESSVLALY